jgi:uncharacterized membrane protein
MEFNFWLFLIGIPLLIIIDYLWINVFNKKFYLKSFKKMGRVNKKGWDIWFFPGLVSWIILVFGIVFFVFNLATNNLEFFLYGAVLGFVIYGVYDTTNLATLKNYPKSFALIDTLWGGFLCGIVSLILYRVSFLF